MNQHPTQMPGREFSVATLIGGLTPILILPGVCALVATAYWLGAGWLANPALGLPAGVWVVILAVAWARLVQDRERRTPAKLPDRSAARLDIAQNLGVGVRWPSNAAASRVLDTTASAASVGVKLARRTLARGVEETLCSWHDRLAWPTRPLRVGLGLTPDLARAIVECDGTSRFEWFTLPYGVTDPGACQRYVLDAVVCAGHQGGMTVFTSVSEEREASWYDWAGHRPLSYASVFPGRVDVERVTLEGAARTGSDASLVRAVIESAAVLSRTSERLSLTDRLRGRRPVSGPAADRSGEWPDVVDQCLGRVGALLAADGRAVFGASELRVAARLVSARLATQAGGAEMWERSRMAEDAAEIAGDEPEVMLRLAAVRIGAGDDVGGIAAILEADRLLRGRVLVSAADQLVFLQSEIALGPVERLTLGRVAAGVCLLAATSPSERLSYLREDLLDEMRLAGWRAGAESDRSLLQEVFKALEKAHKPKAGRSARAA